MEDDTHTSDSVHYRSIAPGRPLPPGAPSPSPQSKLGPAWKKRVSTACLACKKSKRKCSGVPPCENCRALHRECIFDESLDQRRRVAAKRTAEELEYHRDMLNDLFRLVRSAEEPIRQKLLDIIRSDATPEEVRAFIDETLADIQARTPHGEPNSETAIQLKELRRRAGSQGPSPSYRRKVMDVNFLCDTPPIRVPTKPWTTVTDDDDFVSHLMSLYFTWDYPFYAFLDPSVFLKHMISQNPTSDYCSPFLVNAILANACHFSEFSEAFGVPGDVTTNGSNFLREAERLWDTEKDNVNMCTLQGTLLLYDRYSMSGQDNLGYAMLNNAIDMATKLGYIGDEDIEIDLSNQPQDAVESTIRTIWGLFQVDTVAHTGFLKPSRIKHVHVKRLPRKPLQEDTDPWEPYPTRRPPRPAYYHTYFEEACNLSEIASEISRTLFVTDKFLDDREQLSHTVDVLYRKLKLWHENLPEAFDPSHKPAPHILLLHIRYYTILIDMFICPRGTQNLPLALDWQNIDGDETTFIGTSSARAIARLVRIHQSEYGVSRSHLFMLYAINLALFVLLDRDAFSFSDPDFLSLTSPFAIITSRSIYGQQVRSLFTQSIRLTQQVGKQPQWSQLPEDLRDILRPAGDSLTDTDNEISSSSSTSADGGDSATEDELPASSPQVEARNMSEPRSSGSALCEMLCRYETMSLGRDEHHDAKHHGNVELGG